MSTELVTGTYVSTYNISFNTENGDETVIYLNQGEYGFRNLYLVGDLDYSTSATKVKLVGTKPNGLGFSVEGSKLLGGTKTYVFTVTKEMTESAGRIPCEVQLTATEKLIGTANIILSVETNPHPDTTTDGTGPELYNEMTTLLNNIKTTATSAKSEIEEKAKTTKQAIQSIGDIVANNITNTATKATTEIETAVDNAKADIETTKTETLESIQQASIAGQEAISNLTDASKEELQTLYDSFNVDELKKMKADIDETASQVATDATNAKTYKDAALSYATDSANSATEAKKYSDKLTDLESDITALQGTATRIEQNIVTAEQSATTAQNSATEASTSASNAKTSETTTKAYLDELKALYGDLVQVGDTKF